MAQKSQSGKYLQLEDVRVSYNPKTDMFSLTAADGEVRALGGLKLDVSPLGGGHQTLKTLMQNHGLIVGDPWPKLDSEERFELFESNRDPRSVPIGTNINGELQPWSIDSLPNLWVYSTTGGGGVLAQINALLHGLRQGWDLRVFDLSGVEFPRELLPEAEGELSRYIATLDGVTSTVATLRERYSELERIKATSHEGRFQTVLLAIHNIVPILEAARINSPLRSIALGILEGLAELGRLGRIADIHLFLGLQGTTGSKMDELESILGEIIPEDMRAAGYLIFGRLPQGSLPTLTANRYRPFKSFIPGRAHLIDYGRQSDLHVLHIAHEHRTAELERWISGGR